MKYRWLYILLPFVLSCNTGEPSFPKAENALDAGREFIDACLKGDFNKAGHYMIDDSENKGLLKRIGNDYQKKSSREKKEFNDASININDVQEINDSTSIISYKNSYDNIARKLKVIKRKEDWLVDFKYTFSGNL
ncbi:MAG: hypothetical protein JWN76_2904 [Chitinophagaceae bacterium]|nr:hypothetical protein [Chitinophagaceae bacterium]